MRTERRASCRIEVERDCALVLVGGFQARGRIKSLNVAGGVAEIHSAVGESSSLSVDVHLGAHPPFRADIALLGRPAEHTEPRSFAFCFQNLPREGLGVLCAFLCDSYANHNSRLARLFSSGVNAIELGASVRGAACETAGDATIPHLLRYYVEQERIPLFLYRGPVVPAVQLSNVEIGEHEQLVPILTANVDEAVTETDRGNEHLFFFPGSLAVTWFRTTMRTGRGSELIAPLPPNVFQTGFRRSRRVALSAAHSATVTIEEAPQGHMHRQVLDVADMGFAIELDALHDCLCPGRRLNRVQVTLPNGRAELQCVLRGCRRASHGGHMIAGFEILGFASPEDQDRWMRYVISCVFPEVRLGDAAMVSEAWTRLERSGYLKLIERSEGARLRKPFFEDWASHVTHPGHHARLLVTCHEGEPVGVAAMNLVYPKTCLVHSGGVDKEFQGSGRVLKLTSATFLLASSVADYFLMLFEANTPINTVLFQRFVQQYHPGEDNILDTYTVYKWHSGSELSSIDRTSQGPLDVVTATPDLLRALWEHQRKTLSALEIDAYGFSPEDRVMAEYTEKCARDGYERTRRVFFAVHGSLPIAALIAETGSEGMNVFSLLNSCRIELLEGSRLLERPAIRLLLAQAITFYRGAGKGAFLLMGSARLQEEAHIHELGFARVAEGWRWLSTRRVIPAYITYLEDLANVGVGRRRGARSERIMMAGHAVQRDEECNRFDGEGRIQRYRAL